jgi:hypothetical protein
LSWLDTSIIETTRNPGTEIYEAVTLSPQRLMALGDIHGFQVTQDKDGHYLAVPPDADLNDPQFRANFINYWVDQAQVSSKGEHDRGIKIQTYKAMDEVMAEASIALDTYADEALGIGFVDNPVQVKISDPNVESAVFAILGKSEIFKRYRSMIRNMIKYGDLGYDIQIPGLDKDVEDITLQYIDPSNWQCVLAKDSDAVIGYQLGQNRRATAGARDTANRRQPWQFIQMSVFDEDAKPYGRSLLEPMRVDFDHLVVMEALLALSRASKVERLVIKIPTGTNNPVQAAQKIQAVKSSFKSMIFKDTSLGTKSYAKTPALTDILYLPSDLGFDISRLPSGMDLSSTDDVQYFRDRAFTVTGLPKSYFLHDESSGWHSGTALQQQDIIFARKLIRYQDALVEGLVKMITILSVYVTGSNLSNLNIEVRLKRPPQLSSDLITYYVNLAQAAQTLIQTWQQGNNNADIPLGMYSQTLLQLGMPENIAGIFDVSPPPQAAIPDQPLRLVSSVSDIVYSSKDLRQRDPLFEKLVLGNIRESLKEIKAA